MGGFLCPTRTKSAISFGVGFSMRVAVIGAGAVGTVFGALLARNGANVQLYGRGPHLAALREHGATVMGFNGRKTHVAVSVTDDPDSIISADVTLVCAPLHQIESCGSAIRRATYANGAVICAANGITVRGLLERYAPAERVLDGVLSIECEISGFGDVCQKSKTHYLLISSLDEAYGRGIAEALRASGLSVTHTRDGLAEVWRVAAFRAPVYAACCGLKTNVKGVRDIGVWSRIDAAMCEIIEVAGREGHPIGLTTTAYSLSRTPRGMVPPPARDVLAGIPVADTELPVIIEPILEKAERWGVSVQMLRKLYDEAMSGGACVPSQPNP